MSCLDNLTPQQLASIPADTIAAILRDEAMIALCDRLRKRDAEALQTLDDKAVGMACKLIMSPYEEEDEKRLDAMTDEAWKAYDLLYHLVYEDWSEDDGR